MKPKLKIGDRVRITHNRHATQLRRGDRGVIVNIVRGEGWPIPFRYTEYKVMMNKPGTLLASLIDGSHGSFSKRDLRKVEDKDD